MSKYSALLAFGLAAAGCAQGKEPEPCQLDAQAVTICPIEDKLNKVGAKVLNGGVSTGDACEAVKGAIQATLDLYNKTEWELGTDADQYAPSLPLKGGEPVSSYPVYRPVGYSAPLVYCSIDGTFKCTQFMNLVNSKGAAQLIGPPNFVVVPEENGLQIDWFADTGDDNLTLITATAVVINGVKGVADGTFAVDIIANRYPDTEKVAFCPADGTIFKGFISGLEDFAVRAENNQIGK